MYHRSRIGVIRGGISNEHAVSLNTGASVIASIREKLNEKYHVHDIYIDKSGHWHMDGVLSDPARIVTSLDGVFNALHGSYGEDGKIQHLLESHGIAFTGSGSLGSAVGMNKILTKNVFEAHKIKSPYWKEIQSDAVRNDSGKIVRELFHSFILPAIIKPVSGGSSVGVFLVRSYDRLEEALLLAARHDDVVMIEEYIPGIEATCGVVQNFRGQELYALPPIEIRTNGDFFDYKGKYEGHSEEIVPATFDDETKEQIEDLARRIHMALGLRHYSRSDFIVHQKRGIYALEANTLPGLTRESLMPKALRAVGSDIHELVDHLIVLALEG